jgi:hypothetical protein
LPWGVDCAEKRPLLDIFVVGGEYCGGFAFESADWNRANREFELIILSLLVHKWRKINSRAAGSRKVAGRGDGMASQLYKTNA